MSFHELDFLNESDNDETVSGSPGTCDFPFYSGHSVGRVSGVGYGIFVLTGIESIGDVFVLLVSIPRGVEFKVGLLIGSFWQPKSLSTIFSFLVSNSLLKF